MNHEKALKYLNIATAISQLSKDTSTKVGAIVVSPTLEVRTMGYNGAPRGCAADEDARGSKRPEKYFWMEHAERNAIYNAARMGVSLIGSTLVVTHPPCMDCARAIVQAGIARVIWPKPEEDFAIRWIEHKFRVEKLFEECGVSYAQFEH